jgi:cytochrome c oxidase assembly protein subunit 15
MNRSVSSLVKPGWERIVGGWLAGATGLLGGMILVGGYTRLSGSGLSMTSWKFQGTWLPRNQAAWEAEFARYKKFPEYQRLYAGRMTLEEFKQIFFVEWFHRMLGRFTGLYAALPFAMFAATGVMQKRLVRHLGGVLALGGLQGFIGWWMVRSGLDASRMKENERPRVSAYRMAFHWTMALAIFAGTFAPTLWLLSPSRLLVSPQVVSAMRGLRKAMLPATVAAGLTLLSGPFVAGNDAGRAYNNWPMMGDDWIPQEVLDFWSNPVSRVHELFENTAVIQFHHRLLAYSTVGSALWFGIKSRALLPLAGLSPLLSWTLPGIALAQMTLGITTLLMYVPTSLGVAHQGGGLATFATLLFLRHVTRTP